MYSLHREAPGRAGPRVLLHSLRHYALQAKIILADFNLAVSTPTAKLPNLNPCQIFQLYNNMKYKHASEIVDVKLTGHSRSVGTGRRLEWKSPHSV